MSATNRSPLARTGAEGVVIDRHHDRQGWRTLTATPAPGGVQIVIEHSDGRKFRATVPCQACAARVAA